MDPLSFTASLMTVSGVTIMASKLVYTVHEKVKNAPKDVGDLLEQLQTFQELLEEIQQPLQELRDDAAAQSKLLQLWGQSIAHMQHDVESLHKKLLKLEQLLKKKSLSSRILLSARQMLDEKKVAEYQSKIHGHCVVLTCIKGTVCDQKLSRLAQNTIQLGNDNRDGFQTISSQVSQATARLEARAGAGFSNISSNLKSVQLASDEVHRDLQSRMDDHAEREDMIRQNVDEMRCEQMRAIEINEEGFQAVQSALVAAVSSNREAHESTHAMLRQQETLMQRLGNKLASEYSKDCLRWSHHRSNGWGSTTFYRGTLYHSLPVGRLRISIKQTRQREGSEKPASPAGKELSISVTFVPPKWLTCLAVDYRMKLNYDSLEDQWHWGANLRPLTVNQNPFVIDALKKNDLVAIQKSFRGGLIHPTDYVLTYVHVCPWYMIIGAELQGVGCRISAFASLLVYMAENGLPGQEDVLYTVSVDMEYESSATHLDDILQESIRIFVQHGGNLFTGRYNLDYTLQTLLLRGGTNIRDSISRSLFHLPDYWTIDELTSFGICSLGAVAHVDPKFRTGLKECLRSYRSPLLAAGTIYADSLYECTFGIASVLGHFHRLDLYDSSMLLCALCRLGTPSMLRPFIDGGVDLNAGTGNHNMLGNAAAVGNLDIVCMLIERGANGALALSHFILGVQNLSDGLYKHLLELLVENSGPVSFRWFFEDPLWSIIRSPRALSAHPEAPEILFRRKVPDPQMFNDSCQQDDMCSYMCMAITRGLRSVVEPLLRHGEYTNTASNWLVSSIKRGASSCIEPLIQHGADVNLLDGTGRSALELARSNVTAPHPRKFEHVSTQSFFLREWEVTAKEDAKILAAVEQAFESNARSTKSLEVRGSSCELEPQLLKEEGEAIPVAQNILKKALGSLLAYYQHPLLEQHSRYRYYKVGNLWSMSFYEALLVRFFYVLSYALLLAVGILAFIRGDKRVRLPSRSVLSGVALLLLAYIWGSSLQTDFPPLKLDNSRSVTTQDS